MTLAQVKMGKRKRRAEQVWDILLFPHGERLPFKSQIAARLGCARQTVRYKTNRIEQTLRHWATE